MIRIYLVLCILGAALPFSQVAPSLLENRLDLRLFLTHLFASDWFRERPPDKPPRGVHGKLHARRSSAAIRRAATRPNCT
jgi:hypothetical protein